MENQNKFLNKLFVVTVGLILITASVLGIIAALSKDDGSEPQLPTSVSFSDDSWATISQISKTGFANTYYAVGDEKTVTFDVGEGVTEEVIFVILGFNHDNLASGGKAGITFGMKNLLQTNYSMNPTATNIGGWEQCSFRQNILPVLLAQMPAELVASIKTVNKNSTVGGASTNIQTTADILFLFSQVETDGTTNAGYVDEGEQYEYWKIVKDGTVQANRIKTKSGTNQGYFLRSASTEYSNIFNLWANNGALDYKNTPASAARGICFGFCI